MTERVGIIRPPAPKRPGTFPSPVPNTSCANCPSFSGVDVINLTSGMGTCWDEPPKMLGSASGGGGIIVQRTPTHPDWWCMHHPLIKACLEIKYRALATELVQDLFQATQD